MSPQKFAIPGTPMGWTPGTKGLVSGEVVMVTANTDADLAKYKGKLRGKWVIAARAPKFRRNGPRGNALHERTVG